MQNSKNIMFLKKENLDVQQLFANDVDEAEHILESMESIYADNALENQH